MSDTTELSATRLAEAIRRREISPVEAVQAALDRIDKTNPAVNAFVTVCGERALEQAAVAERAVGDGTGTGPLHGVPIGVKDLDPVAGVRMARGSLVFAEDIPQETILCVEKLEQAGAIIVGKTNTPEFGFKATTDSALFGPASTPFNRTMNAAWLLRRQRRRGRLRHGAARPGVRRRMAHCACPRPSAASSP